MKKKIKISSMEVWVTFIRKKKSFVISKYNMCLPSDKYNRIYYL